MPAPIRVFCSYSHKDDKARAKLEEHLAPLRENGHIVAWTDRAIDPGQEWESQIHNALESSDVILFLVSASFLASPYVRGIEVKRALERHRENSAVVIPIILSDCLWELEPFHVLQALPKDGRPVNRYSPRSQAYREIAFGILQIAKKRTEALSSRSETDPSSILPTTLAAETRGSSPQTIITQDKSSLAAMRPRIVINMDYRPSSKEHLALSWIAAGYYDCVIAAGGMPIMLPPTDDNRIIQDMLSGCHGVMLVGSSLDVGFNDCKARIRHPSNRPMAMRREVADRTLCRIAMGKRIPVLAIGAGMQTVNLVAGGTLHNHIPEDVENAVIHRDSVERNLRHRVQFVNGALCHRLYGDGEIRVTSDHHMAVNKLASSFRVSAVAEDGVIEAFESNDPHWYCLGLQWHPEAEAASALDMVVFESFVEAATSFRLFGS